MAEVRDILLDQDLDLLVADGDLFAGGSDKQHVELIVMTALGHWKQFPLLGVGVRSFLASTGQNGVLKSSILKQLISDSYSVSSVAFTITPQSFTVDTNAERIPQS